MQILAFSDLHGNASTLKLLKDSIKYESYDYMLVAGDLTKLVFQRKIGNRIETFRMSKAGWQLLKELEHFFTGVNFGKHLKEEEPVKLGRYRLTSSPKRLPKNAIFLKHHYRRVLPKALLQLDGHARARVIKKGEVCRE